MLPVHWWPGSKQSGMLQKLGCAKPTIYLNCSFLILLFDMFEEWRNLFVGEWHLRQLCHDRLALFISQRMAYWKQRRKFCALREGDANTKFF